MYICTYRVGELHFTVAGVRKIAHNFAVQSVFNHNNNILQYTDVAQIYDA